MLPGRPWRTGTVYLLPRWKLARPGLMICKN
jgi:hypothetical protein